MRQDPTFALLILLWALPVIALQVLIGGDVLLKRWKVIVPSVLVATVYLSVANAVLLSTQARLVSPTQTLGWRVPVLNIPVEEVLLTACSTLMLVFSAVLIFSPQMGQRVMRLWRLLRQGPAALNASETASEIVAETTNDDPTA